MEDREKSNYWEKKEELDAERESKLINDHYENEGVPRSDDDHDSIAYSWGWWRD